MTGYVRLHRSTLENEVWRFDPTAWRIFEALMMLADRSTGVWSGGRYQLAATVNLNPSTSYKALLRLQKAKMVTLSSNNKFTTVSICNWNKYQSDGNTKREQQSNNKVTLNKNIKLKNTPPTPNGEIERVFDFYAKTFGTTIKLTDKRRLSIKRRLADSGVENIITAITNAHSDEFFMGGGPRGWLGDLDYLMRSEENIEKYATRPNIRKEIIF